MKRDTGTKSVILLFLFLLKIVASQAQNEEAVKQYESGSEHYLFFRNDDAIASLKEAIRIYPNYAKAYALLTRIYRHSRKYELAMSSINEAIRYEPKNIEYRNELALTYQYMGKNELALKTYSEAIGVNSANKEVYIERGQFYKELKEYDKALADYGKAIELDPINAESYEARSELYKEAKQYDNALSDINKVLDLNSKNYSAILKRIDIYEAKGLIPLAILEAKTGIKNFPDQAFSFTRRLPDLYLKKGEKALAIQTLNASVSKNPDQYNYLLRGIFYKKIKEYDLALKDYLKAVEISPSNSNYIFLGDLYTEFGKFDIAMAHYEKMNDLFPKNSRPFAEMGNIKKHLGKYDEALEYYESAIVIYPEDVYPYIYKVGCLVRKGSIQEADKLAEKILSDFNSVDNFKYLSFFRIYITVVANDLIPANYQKPLLKLNEADKEFKERESGTDNFFFNILYTDILALKGFILEKLGRNAEAVDFYNQALLINPDQGDIVIALELLKKKPIALNSADKIPPVIELISPQAARGFKIVANKDKTELIGRAKDASGIKNIKVNGVPIAKIEDDGIFVTSLNLTQGINNIVISATDNNNNVTTKTFPITANASAIAAKKDEDIIPVTPEKQPKYYAILIAENEYIDPAIPDLLNPINDAAGLKTILQANYTFNDDDILTLNNKSREEIMQAIVLKCNTLTENDNLVIFYAGHGIAEKDKFGDVDGYWIPTSAKKGLLSSYISSGDINIAIKRSKAKHILVIADACFSGAFTRSLPGASVGIKKQFEVASRKVMASGNLEPVPDNSKFLYYLKKTLESNKEKYISAKKVFDSFYDAIINNTENLPQYAAIKNVGDEGGEFVFIKK